MKKIFYIVLSVVLTGSFISCSKDDLDPTLSQGKEVEKGLEKVADLRGVLNGAYDRMTKPEYYGRDFVIYEEARTDNATSIGSSNRFVDLAAMSFNVETANPKNTWERIYQVISSANIVINAKLETIEGDDAEKKNIVGQAYAIRALAHFDLVKLYGQHYVTGGGGMNGLGVPYVIAFRKEGSLFPVRNTVAEVKAKALADLDQALVLMDAGKNDVNKVTLTTHAVNALKARMFLYFGDNAAAAAAAKLVIDSGEFTVATKDQFVTNFSSKSNANSVFELAVSPTDNNGINGLANMYRGTYGDIIALENLNDLYTASDVRKGIIVMDAKSNLRNDGKYPSMTFDDNIFLIRYEEVLLTYAEAILATDPANALVYLNLIPADRGADLYTSATKENILTERRKEFAFEGFRFDDLVRNQLSIPYVDPIKQTHGGPLYGDSRYAFPIPSAETGANSNVVQNIGY